MSYFGLTKDTTLTRAAQAQVDIDIFHFAIHAGWGFYRTVYSADINGSEINMVFKTPVYTTVQVHMLFHVTAASGALATIYEGGTLAVSNAGDDVIPVNRLRNGTPPESKMSGFDTGAWVANRITVNGVITVGTAVTLDQVPVGSGRKSGGEHDASWELVLAGETVYGIQLADIAAAADNVAHITASWFEVPPA